MLVHIYKCKWPKSVCNENKSSEMARMQIFIRLYTLLACHNNQFLWTIYCPRHNCDKVSCCHFTTSFLFFNSWHTSSLALTASSRYLNMMGQIWWGLQKLLRLCPCIVWSITQLLWQADSVVLLHCWCCAEFWTSLNNCSVSMTRQFWVGVRIWHNTIAGWGWGQH